MNWNEYFMSLVYLTAMKSKDESTKVGAVIIDSENSILSTGFNGICRGVKDVVPERSSRPEKYFWYEHAERNAIFNAARNGVRLKDSRLFTQGLPCADCARAIIQSGIITVNIHSTWDRLTHEMDSANKWKESAGRSSKMFKEAGVWINSVSVKVPSELRMFIGEESLSL